MDTTSSYVPRGFDFATQIVTNAEHPLGERIFIDRDGVVFARVAMTQGTSYGIVCSALLDAFTDAEKAVWDRDDGMDYYRSVTGRTRRLFPGKRPALTEEALATRIGWKAT